MIFTVIVLMKEQTHTEVLSFSYSGHVKWSLRRRRLISSNVPLNIYSVASPPIYLFSTVLFSNRFMCSILSSLSIISTCYLSSSDFSASKFPISICLSSLRSTPACISNSRRTAFDLRSVYYWLRGFRLAVRFTVFGPISMLKLKACSVLNFLKQANA